MTLPTIDNAAFDHLLEITGNDLEFVDELIDTYLADASLQLEAMRAAASSADAAAPGPAGAFAQVEQRQRRGDGPRRHLPGA